MSKKKSKKNTEIGAIIAAYLDDAEFRKVAAPMTLRYRAKAPAAFFGKMTFAELEDDKNGIARAFVQKRRDDGVSDSTVAGEMRLVSAALNFGEREDMIPYALKLIRPKAAGPRRRVLSDSEIGRLLTAIEAPGTPAHIALFVRIQLAFGQRKGATLALKWEHIDEEAMMVWYSRTAARVTKKKRQDQPLHPALLPFLLEAKAKARTDHVIEFRGKPVKDVRSAFQALLARAGIEGLCVHDLRRTAATRVRSKLGLGKSAEFIGDTEATTGRACGAEPVTHNIVGTTPSSALAAGHRFALVQCGFEYCRRDWFNELRNMPDRPLSEYEQECGWCGRRPAKVVKVV